MKKLGVCLGLFLLIFFMSLFLSIQGFCQEPYTFVLKIGGFNALGGIVIDSEDNIYALDSGNCRVQKFDQNGNSIMQFEIPDTGTGATQFVPIGIGIDKSDDIYVKEKMYNPEDYRVQKFNKMGTLLQQWQSSFCSPVRNPAGMDFDLNGNIYMVACFPCDTNPAILKLNPSFECIAGFGHSGYDDSDVYNFCYPGWVAVNSKGEIYVSNWGEFYCGLRYDEDPHPSPPGYPHYHSQIKKFDSNFNFIKRWYLDFVIGIAIDSEDNVYACSQRDWDMGVYKYDQDGNLIQRIAPNCSGYGGSVDGDICGPQTIAVDSKGNVYIVDGGGGLPGGRIQKFAPPRKFDFEGFFSPIDNPPTVNKATAGQTIPVKWKITDKNGLPVSDPASFDSIKSVSISCGAFVGDPTSIIDEYAAGSSGLQYLGDGWWQFNWKTAKTYAGQCRTMKLTLDDGSVHTASFSFK